jgi:menaquinone-dependent protoporphyrinogen oxidase
MARVLVVFATTEGHSAKVAQAIRDRLVVKGHDADVVDAAVSAPDPEDYDAVVVAASLHIGRYQREIGQWVKDHSAALNQMPTAFVSVCLGILEHKPQVDRSLQSILEAFVRSTSWQPVQTKIVAGALKYSHYNFVKRWLMKRIAKKAGGDTDTTRDYEYTDWEDLQEFVDRFSARLRTALVRAGREEKTPLAVAG